MNEYNQFYGSCVVCKDGEMIAVEDLNAPIDIPKLTDKDGLTYVRCAGCGCWMEHQRVNWKCPKCGMVANGHKVYSAIQDVNLDSYEDFEEYFD